MQSPKRSKHFTHKTRHVDASKDMNGKVYRSKRNRMKQWVTVPYPNNVEILIGMDEDDMDVN